MSEIIRNILDNYGSNNIGTKSNLARILMHGKLGGTGKLLILPVDQGFEHGPGKSFSVNPESYDPKYHFQLAVNAGLSAYAAPLGMLESGVDCSQIMPLILKMNSSNILSSGEADQAITASVSDALKLGCVAVGLTIYPGSNNYNGMIEEVKEIIKEAKSCGLVVILWSYPRGGDLSKENETALDVIAYGAHMACLLGAHIIKVKPPTNRIAYDNLFYSDNLSLVERVKIIKQSCFNGKRLVVFSGGNSKTDNFILEEIKAISDGGGDGSIIGRNSFQRYEPEALSLLQRIVSIYKK